MQYLNRNFFKFVFGFLVIVALSLFMIAAFSTYAAGVEKIAFTTEEQVIKPNEISGPITIQTQDVSGISFPTLETLDLEFTSTSATGEFLGSTGNSVTKTMNKNTANRTFYYRDSAEGSFMLTVKAKGRDTLKEWNAGQQITISSSAAPALPMGSQSNSYESSSISSVSQTSSSGAPSVSASNFQLEISAGGDKITSPGSPVNFQAVIKKNTVSNSRLELNWSYGDGNIGSGSLVSHTYKYLGEYVVVLSARAGETFSTSRSKVRVIESDVSLLDQDGYIEISNNSNTEINLFNWKLENSGKGFIFQPNTIILPHSSVRFDKNLLTMKGNDNSLGTSLKNYLNQEVFYIPPEDSLSLSEISESLNSIEKKFSAVRGKAQDLGFIPRDSNTNTQPANIFSTVSDEQGQKLIDLVNSLQPSTETSTENIIYEAPKSESFFNRTWKFFAGLFD